MYCRQTSRRAPHSGLIQPMMLSSHPIPGSPPIKKCDVGIREEAIVLFGRDLRRQVVPGGEQEVQVRTGQAAGTDFVGLAADKHCLNRFVDFCEKSAGVKFPLAAMSAMSCLLCRGRCAAGVVMLGVATMRMPPAERRRICLMPSFGANG